MTLVELVERCEAATADEQREMLEHVFAALLPNPSVLEARCFVDMLNCEAFESAAMTLVPEGWNWKVGHSGYRASSWVMEGVRGGYVGNESYAVTPALALCAAALRARDASPISAAGQL